MKYEASHSFLVSIQGTASEMDVLEHFTEDLDRKSFSIHDIHYLNFQAVHSLLICLELLNSTDKDFLAKELDIVAKKNNFELIIIPLPESSVVSSGYQYILNLLSQQINPRLLTKLFYHLRKKQLRVTEISPFDAEELNIIELIIHADKSIERLSLMRELMEMKSEFQFDLALQADDLFLRNKRLIILDADMTFIQCEMINDISLLAGKETEVAAITDRAMRGKVKFKQALRRLVALLKRLPLSDLQHLIFNISYTSGVECLVYILKILGYQIGLVSGRVTRVIEHIKQCFNLDYDFADTLEVKNGKLTGRISGDILDGHQKGVILRRIPHRENILLEQVIAVGDGANDLEMLPSAGLRLLSTRNVFCGNVLQEACLSKTLKRYCIL